MFAQFAQFFEKSCACALSILFFICAIYACVLPIKIFGCSICACALNFLFARPPLLYSNKKQLCSSSGNNLNGSLLFF